MKETSMKLRESYVAVTVYDIRDLANLQLLACEYEWRLNRDLQDDRRNTTSKNCIQREHMIVLRYLPNTTDLRFVPAVPTISSMHHKPLKHQSDAENTTSETQRLNLISVQTAIAN
jgi:hypothetical protein